MNKRSACLVAVCVTLLGAGCGPAEFQNPLSDPAAAKHDTRLAGSWISREENEDTKMRIRAQDAGMSELVVDSKQDPLQFTMFVTDLDGKGYMNLKATGSQKDVGPNYLIARYELSGDGSTLSLRLTEENYLEKAIGEGKLQGKITTEGSTKNILVTESTEKLAEFVRTSDPEQLFGETLTFKKAEAP